MSDEIEAEPPPLTELELQIMNVIWKQREEISVEEIQQALNADGRPLALPSIRTILKILQKKDYLERRSEGRKHLYSPVISETRGKHGILNHLVERAFDGSSFDLVASLLRSDMVKKGDIDRVKSLLEDLDDEGDSPKSS
ncbi:MAG: BlaI/MecI/CopY family transcriptional regulator [Verrucomicrobiota bacterium]